MADVDPNIEKAITAADMTDAIKTAMLGIGPAIAEAIKPFTDKFPKLDAIAAGVAELEAKKKELNPEQKLNGFARIARALALGRGNLERAIFEAKKNFGADDYATKALTASDPSAAGGLIPQVYAAEFVELLRGRTVIRALARILPMTQGNLTMKRATAGGTAYYVGESTNVTPSQQTIGDINFAFRKLVALTPVSNSLLRMASPAADSFVREDLLSVMSLREDAAFLTDDGTANTPLGLFNLIDAANQFVDGGTTYLQQIADYTKAIKLIEEANVPITDETGHWILAPRVFWGIYKTEGAAAGESTAPFKLGLQLPEPRLIGYRVHKTTQAKKVANGGTDLANTADRIYFVHAPAMIIADSLNLQVDTFDGAAYYDGTNVVSGVSRDETVIRVISEHDFNLRHSLAGAVITGVSVGS